MLTKRQFSDTIHQLKTISVNADCNKDYMKNLSLLPANSGLLKLRAFCAAERVEYVCRAIGNYRFSLNAPHFTDVLLWPFFPLHI